jgi:hypothetical protein
VKDSIRAEYERLIAQSGQLTLTDESLDHISTMFGAIEALFGAEDRAAVAHAIEELVVPLLTRLSMQLTSQTVRQILEGGAR